MRLSAQRVLRWRLLIQYSAKLWSRGTSSPKTARVHLSLSFAMTAPADFLASEMSKAMVGCGLITPEKDGVTKGGKVSEKDLESAMAEADYYDPFQVATCSCQVSTDEIEIAAALSH